VQKTIFLIIAAQRQYPGSSNLSACSPTANALIDIPSVSQVSTFTQRQNFTSNYAPEAAAQPLLELLELPWQGASVRTLQEQAALQITKKGRAIWQRTAVMAQAGVDLGASLSHDRRKAQALASDTADPFLQTLGLQTADGRVRASMQAKFTQVRAKASMHINSWPGEQYALPHMLRQ
jgi:hypothetical protein